MIKLKSEDEPLKEDLMAECKKCNDTGSIDTGNNDLPCDCPAGKTALFNVAGAPRPVSGAEVERHYLNGSPMPLESGEPIPTD